MMSGMKQLSGLALLAVSAIGVSVGSASQKPPVGTKGLTEIVTRFEAVGCQIVEASFDKGRWELEGYRSDLAFELAVDRDSERLVSIRQDDGDPPPPAGAKPLSQILNEVTRSGCTQIVGAELKHGQWKVEAYRELSRRELQVDAISGAILTEQAD